MRADAARNREQIVGAARELVASQGETVTMEQLAERAGVAVGTLYRHFPTKTALVAAVVEESVDRIADLLDAALERAQAGGSARAEMDQLFLQLAADYDADRAVKQAAASMGVPVDLSMSDTEGDSAAARAARSLGALLAAAQEAGEVRGDVTVGDLVMLLTQLPEGRDAESQRSRYARIVLAGLRP